MKKELTRTQALILLFIFVALGGIILYNKNSPNNWNPLNYVLKR